MCPGFDSFDKLVLDECPRFVSFDTELRELWKVSFELWWWWWESFELRGSGEDNTEKSTSTSITWSRTLVVDGVDMIYFSLKLLGDNSSSELNLCLISSHLLEDGEVEIDLLDADILLLEVEREEELSRVAGPELTELKLLLTFS